MFNRENEEQAKANWKTQIYLIGVGFGAFMGFLSAYLFAKEAEDSADDIEKRPEVTPITLLGLGLSILTLVRQIGETGRKKDSGKK